MALTIDLKALENAIQLMKSETDWFDTWYGLGPRLEYDLNLYEYEGGKFATIYPVADGNTETEAPIITIEWRD